jgi:hypothetical protein
VDTLDDSAGGSFNFNGGLLKVVNIEGNLTNNGGTFSPGASPAKGTLSGDYTQNVGITHIELAGTTAGSQYDQLLVGGSATLNSGLLVNLLNGFSPTSGQAFQVLVAAAGVNGTFTNPLLPTLSGGLFWNLLYGSNSLILAVAPSNNLTVIPGDYNQDGMVDAADFTAWRDRLGSSNALADGNFDGQVTLADYTIWKSHFGFSLVGGGLAAASLSSVPEPATAVIAIAVFGSGVFWRRRRKC